MVQLLVKVLLVLEYCWSLADTVDETSITIMAASTAAGPARAGIEACQKAQAGADSWLLLLASIGGCCSIAIIAVTETLLNPAASAMSGCCRAITCTGSEQPNMGSFHMVQYLLSK
jgi:hypothetical protein